LVCAEATPANITWASAQKLPSSDAPILAAAVQAGAEMLVTGDQTDFGHLFGKTLRGTEVLPPVRAVEHIIAGE
jgi:predicted nucleic acid-binding protein